MFIQPQYYLAVPFFFAVYNFVFVLNKEIT